MDRRGSGFEKIRNGTNRLFNDNDNHVEFFASEFYFSVVIYNANYNKVEKMVKEKSKDKGKEIMNKIIEQLSLNGYITVAELSNVLSLTEKTIRYYMNKLRDNGIIERKGSTKSGKWIVVDNKK